jgi:D-xylose transport system substrate-binding protein
MKKRILLLLVLAMVIGSFSVATTVGAQDSVDVVVLLPDSASSARWENDDRRYLAQAFEEAGVTYSIVNAEGDRQTQNTQAEQAITNGAKVLLLVNLDSGSGAAIIAQAHDAGAKVIDYDRLTIEGPGADYYISFDNVAVGRLEGQGVLDAVKAAQAAGTIGDVPKVAILNGSPTDNNATLLAQGYHGVLDPLFDSGQWQLVADQSVPDWDNQQALVIFEQMQTDNPEIDAAVAANDGLAGSVIAARQNAGLPFIPVSGQDATVGGIQNVLAGRQSVSVYKAIRQEARAAAGLAIAILNNNLAAIDTMVAGNTVDNGTNPIPSILLVPIAVTKDNVAQTVIADGFRTWDEICVGDFAQYCPADR